MFGFMHDEMFGECETSYGHENGGSCNVNKRHPELHLFNVSRFMYIFWDDISISKIKEELTDLNVEKSLEFKETMRHYVKLVKEVSYQVFMQIYVTPPGGLFTIKSCKIPT
ncbi:hypothetical protein L1987_62677 [Smallanthus sonchifolius]|uniref:Uncharacterized protein n=1 Tax=Smallanthus sonchifolius TaxID=185202 RepID=A0ACB9CB47_9ASTR|nr:hypothetical protein L1987_62677 [Smallanthus sonchifolius]